LDKENISKIPSNYIKAEMKRKGLFAKDMIKLLKDYDENLNLQSFHNKISRGNFSAVFFFKCMYALDIKTVRLED